MKFHIGSLLQESMRVLMMVKMVLMMIIMIMVKILEMAMLVSVEMAK